MNTSIVTPTISNSATNSPIEVLVLPPHGLPSVAKIEADAQNGYLPAIQCQIAGPALEEFKALEPFPVAAFDTHEAGTVGFCHGAIIEGRGQQLDHQHFPFNNRVLHLPYTLYGTFIIAAGSNMDALTSLTPEQLAMLLGAFASGLEPAEYDRVMRGHSQGARFLGDSN